jgi:CubicO group peptidase (beta-lactamase class C family)
VTHRIDRRQFAAALLAPAVGAVARPPAAAAPAVRPLDDAFLARLPRIMELADVPGVGICVVQDGRVAAQHHLGVASTESREPVSARTLWVAASLSKPVCAFAALRLADEGRLDLDRPLKQYVPDHAPADPRADRITARHVLSHSSGLPNWRRRDDEPLVPAFEPGARFRYSGEGFFYLQRAVERVAGRGFERHMQERVFAPLGMTSSTYSWREDVPARLVVGHDRDGNRVPTYWQANAIKLLAAAERRRRPLAAFTADEVRAEMRAMTPAPPDRSEYLLPNAASSLVTTPADYGAFLGALLTGAAPAAALAPATRRAMMAPQTRVNGALAWGLGWGLEWADEAAAGADPATGAAPPDYLWHWGDNGSWKNFVLVHPASRSAVAVFTNGSRGLNVAERVVAAATGRDHPAFLWL